MTRRVGQYSAVLVIKMYNTKNREGLVSSFYQYWKYSRAQRIDFLENYKSENLDLIPYWSTDWTLNKRHCSLKPQAPLLDIIDWAKRKGKVLSLYVPLTPCPLVPDGGLPFINKVNALDFQSMSLSIMSSDQSVNHIHSAYERDTPELFYIWLEELKKLCEKKEVGIHWWGLRSYYPHNIYFHSYQEDSSHAFEKAFSQYVKSNRLSEGESLLREKDKFQKMVGEFYLASLDDVIGESQYKLKTLCFLKGSPESIFWQEVNPLDELSDISLDFCRSFTYGMSPDFSLVSRQNLPDEAWNFFSQISPKTIDYRDVYMQNSRIEFRPLTIFKIWGDGSEQMIEEKANEIKLTTFFFNFFRWTYKIEPSFIFDDEETSEQIVFCLQENFTNDQVRSLAQSFSKGQKFIFFLESFNDSQWRFWIDFISSNGYFKEEMLFQGKIHYFSNEAGGQVTILSRIALSRLGVNQAVELWEKMITFFNVNAFKINHSEGVNYFWQQRDVRSHELSYKEVRRVFIHNTTEASQRVFIKKIRNGSLIKVSERVKAKVSTDDDHIWIELGTLGMTSLEFGIIE